MSLSSVLEAVIAVFRFLNLLEPGKKIISISKVFMWVTVFAAACTLYAHPENITAVLGTAGGQLLATANYAYRRHIQNQANDPPSA